MSLYKNVFSVYLSFKGFIRHERTVSRLWGNFEPWLGKITLKHKPKRLWMQCMYVFTITKLKQNYLYKLEILSVYVYIDIFCFATDIWNIFFQIYWYILNYNYNLNWNLFSKPNPLNLSFLDFSVSLLCHFRKWVLVDTVIFL